MSGVAYQRGDRIVFAGQYVGTLLGKLSPETDGPRWFVNWDDGADPDGNTAFPEDEMQLLNGGPSSATHTVPARDAPDRVAYELRTANLIAYARSNPDTLVEGIDAVIRERLGLAP